MDINFNKLRFNHHAVVIMHKHNINTSYIGATFRVPNFVISRLLIEKGVKCYVRK